jgi:hypothetical protein
VPDTATNHLKRIMFKHKVAKLFFSVSNFCDKLSGDRQHAKLQSLKLGVFSFAVTDDVFLGMIVQLKADYNVL